MGEWCAIACCVAVAAFAAVACKGKDSPARVPDRGAADMSPTPPNASPGAAGPTAPRLPAVPPAAPAPGDAGAGAAGSESTVGAPATGSPEACRTVVQDPAPPLNVREEARRGAAVVGTLDNGTEVRVAERRLPWLRLAAPVEGWIWAASTVEECDAP